MRLHNLKPRPGAKHRRKRLGQGESSGHGKTSGRGGKGQTARSGSSIRIGFEGGQMPLIRRVPKFGFTSPFRVAYEVVNLSTLEALVKAGRITGGAVTPEDLYALGTVTRKAAPVKILGDGNLSAPLSVTAHAFSKSAVQKIEAAGGKALTVSSTAK